ncbi:MAG: hypothetical protein GQ582_12590 [Methyloprofundus sp.]|nr:hypothetical protein [Methyloprofundus sp.]
MRLLFQFTLCLIFINGLNIPFCYADNIFNTSTEIPEGFENLASEQHTEVDVFFAGQKIISTYARFSPGEFSFDYPAQIIAAIPTLKNSTDIIQALSGQVKTHQHLNCQRPHYPKGCGTLNPEFAGIIFNANRFRVDVFINPQFLEVIPLNVGRYLPWPDDSAGIGGLMNFNGNIAGSTQQKLRYSFTARSILAYGLTHFNLDMHINDARGYQVESLVAERETRDWVASVGMLRNTPVRMLGQKEILGINIGSSLKLRTDLERAYGNEVIVFLPRRAMVSIFRDERLLSAKMYEAGNQSVDTQDFPNGAYDIRIVIDDPIQGTQEEVQFYSKATDIPPLGSPSYFIEAGVMRSDLREDILPKYSLKPLFNLGGAMRFTDTFAADIGLLASLEDQVLSAGVTSLHRLFNSQIRLGAMASVKGDYGVEVSGVGNYQDFSVNLSFRKLASRVDRERDRFSLIPLHYTQFSASLGYSLWRFRMNLRTNWRRSETLLGSASTFSISPAVAIRLFRYQGLALDFDLQHTFSNIGHLTLARFNFQFTPHSQWDYSAGLETQHQYQPEKTNLTGYLQANWQDDNLFPADLTGQLSFRNRDDNYVFQAQGSYNGAYGGSSAFVSETILSQGGGLTNYGGNFNFSVLAEQQGIALGGQYPGASAVIIDLQGTPKGASFDVEIIRLTNKRVQNGQNFSVFVGKANALPLPAYETYQIRLIARKATFAEFDTSPRTVTLYPGMIQRLVWEVKQVYILITGIVDEKGEPVINANVIGAIDPAFTDASGFLQADVEAQAELILNREDGRQCLVSVPEIEETTNIATFTELVCTLLEEKRN